MRLRGAIYVTRVGKYIKGFVGKPQGKRNLGDLVTDGRIILKWISNRL
jgi:hypothetical protein